MLRCVIWESSLRLRVSAVNTASLGFAQKVETPPALAAWSLNFDLVAKHEEIIDTTDFSRVEFQLPLRFLRLLGQN
jgi:hypothetical protein